MSELQASLSNPDTIIYVIMRTFIRSVIDTEVIKGLQNMAPMPVGGFIAMTPISQSRLSMNVNSFHDGYLDDPQTASVQQSMQPIRFDMQIDCYGALANDWAVILSTLLRDDYAYTAMQPYIAPLYISDPRQLPIVNGEQNYEQRWTFDAAIQYNPIVTVPIDFFDQATIDLIAADVDTTYIN